MRTVFASCWWLAPWLSLPCCFAGCGRNPPRHVALALGLIIGGGLGNVLDRLRHGAVVDFLDFHLSGWHWPAFNVADSCIFVGVVLLVCDGMVEQLFQGKNTGDTEV